MKAGNLLYVCVSVALIVAPMRPVHGEQAQLRAWEAVPLQDGPAIGAPAEPIGRGTRMEQPGCAAPSWNVENVSTPPERPDATEGVFGSTDFDWQLANPRTFEARFRARAADNSGLGILACIVTGECTPDDLLDWVLEILDWVSFSKGELARTMDLRLQGQPGMEAQLQVVSNLDGLIAVSSFLLAGSYAKVTADLAARPEGGAEYIVLHEEREDDSYLDQGAYFTPIARAATKSLTLPAGAALHLDGHLRAESRSEKLILGAAIGAAQFSDPVGGGYFDQLEPPIAIPNPEMKVSVTIVNVSPVLTLAHPGVDVIEGEVASNGGTLCDGDNDAITLTASVGSVVNHQDGTWSWNYPAGDGPATQVVTVSADDGKGGTDTISFTLSVRNAAPTVDAGADQTAYRGDSVTLSGGWFDPAGALDEPYLWKWDTTADGVPDLAGSAPYCSVVPASAEFATEGEYALMFQVADHDGAAAADTLLVNVLNRPPDCSQAVARPGILWPANHEFVTISIIGVTDPEGDTVSFAVDHIAQDEAVDAPGSGNTSPDGQGLGTATAQVRAERMGAGDGRVYHLRFTAVDGHGGECTATVQVAVPRAEKKAALDGGPIYDSTAALIGASGAINGASRSEAANDEMYLPLVTR